MEMSLRRTATSLTIMRRMDRWTIRAPLIKMTIRVITRILTILHPLLHPLLFPRQRVLPFLQQGVLRPPNPNHHHPPFHNLRRMLHPPFRNLRRMLHPPFRNLHLEWLRDLQYQERTATTVTTPRRNRIARPSTTPSRARHRPPTTRTRMRRRIPTCVPSPPRCRRATSRRHRITLTTPPPTSRIRSRSSSASSARKISARPP